MILAENPRNAEEQSLFFKKNDAKQMMEFRQM